MKCFFSQCTRAALVLSCLTSLIGCGGGAEEAVPAAASSSGSSSASPMAMGQGGYGGESEVNRNGTGYGGEGTGGASYGGESGSMSGGMGASGGMGMGAPVYMGPGESSGMMGAGNQMGGQMGYGEMGYGGEDEGMGGSYDMRSMAGNAGSGSGMGMGMSGGYDGAMQGGSMGQMPGMPGGYGSGGYGSGGFGGNSGTSGIVQFLAQNCASCHGNVAPKGNVNLVAISTDFADDPSLWEQVIEQVESDAMPPASAQRRPTPQQQQAFVAMVKAELSKAGLGEGQDYLVRAKSAFARGKEAEAVNYFYAQTLTASDEDAQTLLRNARWFAAGKRPVTTLRFAVGIVLNAPEGLDVKPIGTKQLGGGAGGGGQFGMAGGYGESGGTGNTTKQRSFYELTGDLGQALASEFETRWTSGALGSVFSDVVAFQPNANDRNNGMGMGMGMGMGDEGGGMGMMGGSGMEGYGGPGGGGNSTANRKTINPGQTITPGLTYLGTGAQKDLLKKAADQGIDGMFLFDIEATSIRTSGMVSNSTRLRLMLTDGSVVSMTKTLKNIDVERAKMRTDTGDDVEKNMKQLFNKFDSELKLSDMPALKPEAAKGRLLQLVNDKSVDKMRTLFEAKLYHTLGAVTQDELATVFQIALRGNEGISLASGTPADRKLVVKEVVLN